MQGNQLWELPQRFGCYKRAFQQLQATKFLFQLLFLEYKLCFKCIFRFYNFEHPRLYNDSAFYLQILPNLLDVTPQSIQFAQYDVSQCCMQHLCWLCQGIFQKEYLSSVTKEVLALVAEQGFDQWQKFKLNIRIPSIIYMRNLLLSRYVYYTHKEGQNVEQLQAIYNILILPIETGRQIDPKTVLKWVLAHELNQSTNMTSTSQQNSDNLVISLEQECKDQECEMALMDQFCSFLGLQKKKEKNKGRKACLDLVPEKEKEQKHKHHQHPVQYKCNAYNLGKITALKQPDFNTIFSKLPSRAQFWQLIIGNSQVLDFQNKNITHKVALQTKNVYLCGRYIKYSRYLSQTPWIINGKKLTEGSLQEEIEDRIYKLFYPGRTKDKVEIRFHSGGREDIDVRMLKGGRPFVLQFVNPIKSIKSLQQKDILAFQPEAKREYIQKEFDIWSSGQQKGDIEQLHSWRIVKLLQFCINYQNPYVQVLQFQETTQSFISVQLKAAETEKIKHYLCYIYSMQPLSEQDKHNLDQIKDLSLQQLTPLRVLHRRTLLIRDKTIHRLKMHLVSHHSAILQVWASAGTYIKEFVHGDLGRTTPNIGSLLGKQVDILQLDVGSLKEGQWQEGDEELMKMDKPAWMD